MRKGWRTFWGAFFRSRLSKMPHPRKVGDVAFRGTWREESGGGAARQPPGKTAMWGEMADATSCVPGGVGGGTAGIIVGSMAWKIWRFALPMGVRHGGDGQGKIDGKSRIFRVLEGHGRRGEGGRGAVRRAGHGGKGRSKAKKWGEKGQIGD